MSVRSLVVTLVLAAPLALGSVASAAAATAAAPAVGSGPAGASKHRRDAGAALRRLIDEQWAEDLRANPLDATSAGESRYNDRLPDASPAAYERAARADAAFLARLRAIDRAALAPEDRLNRDLLEFVLQHRVALAPYRAWRTPLVSDDGFHIEV